MLDPVSGMFVNIQLLQEALVGLDDWAGFAYASDRFCTCYPVLSHHCSNELRTEILGEKSVGMN